MPVPRQRDPVQPGPEKHSIEIAWCRVASRQHRPVDEGNIEALADIEHRINQELRRHETTQKLAERIRKDAEELGEEIRKGDDKLGLLLRKAKDTLKALNVELAETEAERAQPILAAPLLEIRGELTGRVAAE